MSVVLFVVSLIILLMSASFVMTFPVLFFLFFLINLFIYLFLTLLGVRCCVRAFSSCGEQGLLFVVVHGLLIAVVSLVVEHGL